MYHLITFSLVILNDILPSSSTTIQFLLNSDSEHLAIGFVISSSFVNFIAMFPSFSVILYFSFSSLEHSMIGFRFSHFSSIFKYKIPSFSTILCCIFSFSEHSERVFIVSSSFVSSTKITPSFSLILCVLFSLELHSSSGIKCSICSVFFHTARWLGYSFKMVERYHFLYSP